MNVVSTKIDGVVLLEPRVFQDDRGYFFESFHKTKFAEAGLPSEFVQDNHSKSARGALRGLHYQFKRPQAKLVRVVFGEVFDVAVDLRKNSPTFGQWCSAILSAENKRQIFIPPQFAHGFCALTEGAEVVYKCTDVYHPDDQVTIAWNDPQIDVRWPVPAPLLSEKDACGISFRLAPCFD